ALIGSTFQQTVSDRQALIANGFKSDDVMEDIAAASSLEPMWDGSIHNVYKYNAAFGRISANWQNKYILTVNARRDGSSRFGPENKFRNFISLGGAWIFVEEKWIKDHIPAFSFGKIRASYGTTGSDQIGDYAYLSLYNNEPSSVPYQTGSTGLVPRGLPNPYLQWEETRKLQVGLDLGFWQDRILLNMNYSRNRSSNQLLSYRLPYFTGFNSVNTNFPATVQNTGLEVALSVDNIHRQDFRWSASANITIPRNKLLKFPGIEETTYANYLFVGKSITTRAYYDLVGVDPTTGLYLFRHKDKTISSYPGYGTENKTVLLNSDQRFYGGLENSFTYKGFQLSFLFQFVKQLGMNYTLGASGTGWAQNQSATILNAWRKPGDAAAVQRYSLGFEKGQETWEPYFAAQYSDAVFVDASFVRLKNVALSWRLPESLLKSMGIRDMRFYFEGQNLFTYSGYHGVDPETQGTTLPPLRVLTAGIQLTF
ncbi:MAG: SusC/RagA family TonB-linked outer membrane protein, partial [Chitinophagaceae bacterium]|nr:SusC/RagA family TonB-linked outer membrane protein [Chitinophagaceae bacterium]